MGFIKKHTVGAFHNLDQSVDKRVGEVFGGIDYVTKSTERRIGRSLSARFSHNAIRQLGKEINPDHKYRIYTNSMNPGIQVRKGRIHLTPKVLEYQLNRGQTDPNEKIGVELGDDGLVRYRIQTNEGREQLVTLKQMNTETREWVGQRVSDAIDNSAQRYAGVARLAHIMGKRKLSFGYETASGIKSSRNFSVSFLYDFMMGSYNEERHPYYKHRNVIGVIAEKMQTGILNSLKKQKRIDEHMSWEQLVGIISGVSIESLHRSDINAYEGIFKQDYGVQRKQTHIEGSDSFDAIAKAAGYDPEALKKSQEDSQKQTKEEDNKAETQEENSNTQEQSKETKESSEAHELDHKQKIASFLREPAKHRYDDVTTDLLLWHMDGAISETIYNNALKRVEAIHKQGKFSQISQSQEQSIDNVISLAGDKQMQIYITHATDYARGEVEEYLADLGAKGQITEKRYNEYLKKMDKLIFKDANIQAKAVA